MKLHFRSFGEGEPLIILHGVFGSSDNWQTLGKAFSDEYKVYLVDLRNHGRSPHSETFTYEAMAADLITLMDAEGLASAHILGHSMGGKVAMQLASTYPQRVAKLIVVDIAPRQYPPHHQQIFEGFRAVKLNEIKSRGEADKQLATVISNLGIRQFILKNLDRDDQGFRWKLNLPVIEREASQIGASVEEKESFGGEALFIAGGNSDYIRPEDHVQIRASFPKAKITTIEGAGHWVHAEKPTELKAQVLDFL